MVATDSGHLDVSQVEVSLRLFPRTEKLDCELTSPIRRVPMLTRVDWRLLVLWNHFFLYSPVDSLSCGGIS